TGLGKGQTAGVAGMFKVSQTADIGIPNVGSLFQASGTVSVMFNSTRQDVVFQVPQAFLPLLDPGDPTTLTIFSAAPRPDGGRNPSASPEIYVAASIQASLTIGGVLMLTGFIQITAGVGNNTGRLVVTGAVSANVRFLGSLTGTINLV